MCYSHDTDHLQSMCMHISGSVVRIVKSQTFYLYSQFTVGYSNRAVGYI